MLQIIFGLVVILVVGWILLSVIIGILTSEVFWKGVFSFIFGTVFIVSVIYILFLIKSGF